MIHAYLEQILLRLSISPIVQTFSVLKQKEGDDEGYLRVKCTLCNGDLFEFSEYVIIEPKDVHVKRYNFHWQTSEGRLLMRWDNVEHHREIQTFPHHVHCAEGIVEDSAPMRFEKVITSIEQALQYLTKEDEVFSWQV